MIKNQSESNKAGEEPKVSLVVEGQGLHHRGKLVSGHWYVVEVSFAPNNPVHLSILYAGLVSREGDPGPYHYVTHPTHDQRHTIHDLHYLRILRDLGPLLEGGR